MVWDNLDPNYLLNGPPHFTPYLLRFGLRASNDSVERLRNVFHIVFSH